MGKDEEYTPAIRPEDTPGGDHVRFEREGAYEQLLVGGGAEGIEQSILRSTERNLNLIGWTIVGVGDVVGNLGDGTLQEISFMIEHSNGERKVLTISGLGMRVKY
jgi:hypothetical protein